MKLFICGGHQDCTNTIRDSAKRTMEEFEGKQKMFILKIKHKSN